jgi:hypothetical protein
LLETTEGCLAATTRRCLEQGSIGELAELLSERTGQRISARKMSADANRLSRQAGVSIEWTGSYTPVTYRKIYRIIPLN